MTTQKFDYSKINEDIFYKIIYPIYAMPFLFGSDYEIFASIVENTFILNTMQWEAILEHWEQKQSILKFETR